MYIRVTLLYIVFFSKLRCKCKECVRACVCKDECNVCKNRFDQVFLFLVQYQVIITPYPLPYPAVQV